MEVIASGFFGLIIGVILTKVFRQLNKPKVTATQEAKVLAHLKVTALNSKEAVTLYDIKALRSVVARLRSRGHKIDMTPKGKMGVYTLK